jgi:OFA family oxalate/formate antiporter-like MFS transporter
MPKRYVVLAAALTIQACLGGIYAWSVFVPSLRTQSGLTAAQAQAVFGTTIAVFALTMTVAGRLVSRLGTRRMAALGGALFGCGYLVASLSSGAFLTILLGIGVVTGMGIGCAYVCPLVACVRWFPRHQGLITGVAVAGFGGGAVLKVQLVEHLLARGHSVLQLFQWIGASYGSVVALAALALASPAERSSPSGPAPTPLRPLLASDRLRRLALGMTCGTFAGLLVIGNLKPLGLASGLDVSPCAAAVGLLAVGNAAGRLAWGWIYDRLAARAIPLSLLLVAAAVGLLIPAARTPRLFPLAAALVGLCFGACFVLYAAQVAAEYGTDQLATAYPIVFLGYGLAGVVGPITGGWLFDATRSYVPGLVVAVTLALIGAHATRRLATVPRSAAID